VAKVRPLEHVGLGTRRDAYEATVRFYEQVFGWHRLRELPGELTFLGDGEGGRMEVFPTDSPALANPHHLAFGVDLDEFDAVRDALRQAGATLDEPYVNEFDDRIGYFNDPAGNRAQIVGRNAELPK
jgi:catechol 2,3-dioxygenase-like lactoylglutathione lyase family enzyme